MNVMNTLIYLHVEVEDELSKAVILKILQHTQRFQVTQCLVRGGNSQLKKIILGLNHAAKGRPYLVLTDLDNVVCPLALIQTWLPHGKHHNLLFRVAVREIESWLLADRESIMKFFGLSGSPIPEATDDISKPKEFLIQLARQAKPRELREAIVPRVGSTAKVGRDYNGALLPFVQNKWQIEVASRYSNSFRRTLQALNSFEPKSN